MDEALEKKKNATLSFAKIVGFGGIWTPCFAAVAFNFWIDNIANSGKHLLLLIFFLGVAGAMPLVAYVLYDKKPQHEKWIDILLYFSGFAAILLIGFLMRHTGGLANSLFAFFPMFIPAAIAIAFEAKWGLLIVSSTSFWIYYWDAFPSRFGGIFPEIYSQEVSILPVYSTAPYKYTYLAIVALHFLLIYAIEMHSRQKSGSS